MARPFARYLRAGLSAVPIWMQEFLREILRADSNEAKP